MGEWVSVLADFTRRWDAPQEIAPARFAARQGFVVARKRKICQHKLCRDVWHRINISLHPSTGVYPFLASDGPTLAKAAGFNSEQQGSR